MTRAELLAIFDLLTAPEIALMLGNDPAFALPSACYDRHARTEAAKRLIRRERRRELYISRERMAA